MKITKKYLIIGIISIVMMIVTITAVTYSFVKSEEIQKGQSIISTLDCMEVTINGVNESIKLNNAFPLTDESGMKTTPYMFKVTNNCDTFVDYKIVMSVMNTSSLRKEEYIKTSLTGPRDSLIASLDLLEKESSVHIIDGSVNNYVIMKNHFNKKESHLYNYRMWLNGNSEDIWVDETISNTNLEVKLSIVAVTMYKPETINKVNENEYFLGSQLLKSEIEEITFVNTNIIPEDVLGNWKVSETSEIVAWYTASESDNMYKVTIGQNGGVFTGEDSSLLFKGLTNLKELDLTNLNTKFTTNMDSMFYEIGKNIEEVKVTGLNKLNTSGVISLNKAFKEANIKTIDIKSWNISKVENMDNMFDGATFDTLRIDNWANLSASKEGMFNNIKQTSKIFVKNNQIKEEINLPSNTEVKSNT